MTSHHWTCISIVVLVICLQQDMAASGRLRNPIVVPRGQRRNGNSPNGHIYFIGKRVPEKDVMNDDVDDATLLERLRRTDDDDEASSEDDAYSNVSN